MSKKKKNYNYTFLQYLKKIVIRKYSNILKIPITSQVTAIVK